MINNVILTPKDNFDTITESPFTSWNLDLDKGLFIGMHIVGPGVLYLDTIDKGRCIFSSDSGRYAYCTIIENSNSAIYSLKTGGVVGICVFGSTDTYSSLATYTPSSKTYIAPHNILPLTTEGRVLSFKDKHGNTATGAVRFVAGSGVSIEYDEDNEGFKININPDTDDRGGRIGKPVKRIKFSWDRLTNVIPTKNSSNSVNLTYLGRSLASMCESRKYGTLPDMDGNLPDPNAKLMKTVEPSKTNVLPGSFVLSAKEAKGGLAFTTATANGGVSRISFGMSNDNCITIGLEGK